MVNVTMHETQSCIPTSALPRGSAFAINEAHREDSGADQRASGSQPLRSLPSPTAKNPRHHSLHCLLVDDLRATCLTFQCNCPDLNVSAVWLSRLPHRLGVELRITVSMGRQERYRDEAVGPEKCSCLTSPDLFSHAAMLMIYSNDTAS